MSSLLVLYVVHVLLWLSGTTQSINVSLWAFNQLLIAVLGFPISFAIWDRIYEQHFTRLCVKAVNVIMYCSSHAHLMISMFCICFFQYFGFLWQSVNILTTTSLWFAGTWLHVISNKGFLLPNVTDIELTFMRQSTAPYPPVSDNVCDWMFIPIFCSLICADCCLLFVNRYENQ
jgi:hypothetical protein